MRLDKNTSSFIKTQLEVLESGSKIYLFGSRVDDNAKGGDIDILWLTHKKVPGNLIRKFRTKFYKQFGWRKIDIINFLYNEESIFKEIALEKAVEL